ncbi:DUF4886 domain-containing protein [Fluviicola taffensis]|uniref:Uncharacterized protein n=1 Tax=Fluviicola taffensis (strain DSM 16823 / NCIMB 13979 / RW262) TaxID=755732 RepID=F2II02_FLUTR|nr:DUF4886 domain-containing protein [Fluviicola taffensis]AEA42702.1 hypothetical protein Fluta_0698 [Fluviicola taffensis DSM 16823]
MKGNIWYIFLFLLIGFSCSESQKTIRVLFVGNSYTYRNNMPKLFEEIAKSKGDDISVTHITRGKYTFYLQAKRKKLERALRKENWDVIVLQGSSRDMLRDSVRFKEKTFPALDKLLGLIHTTQKQAKVYFYMTWPYKNGDRKIKRFANPDSMLMAVSDGYSNLRNRYKTPVIPVGKVWRAYSLKYPKSNLYVRDNSHPSYSGSYLVACTMYSVIIGKSPVGASNVSIYDNTEYSQIQYFIGKEFKTKDFNFFLKDSI